MDLKSMTLQEMQEYMESIGEKKFRAKQIYEWFHKHLALSLDEMNNVPKKLQTWKFCLYFISGRVPYGM